jgi:hypothetical protein
MTTLTYQTTTLDLPDDLYWSDEASWQPVVQTAERTITGALVVQTHARIAGRPITLQPEAENSAWITRATLVTLMAWASIPGCEMLLSHRGISYNVVWRHQDGEVIQATPVVHYADVQTGDYYTATLSLMEI